MQALSLYEARAEEPAAGTLLETIFDYVRWKLYQLRVAKEQLSLLTTTLLYGAWTAQAGDVGSHEIGDALENIESMILNTLLPGREETRKKLSEEKKEAIEQLRKIGPLHVTSLQAPSNMEKFSSTFFNIKRKIEAKNKKRGKRS